MNNNCLLLLFSFFTPFFVFGKISYDFNRTDVVFSQKEDSLSTRTILNVAPILIATGNQIYCPTTAINIVTDFNIIDPDDTGIDAMFVQISTGYVAGQDFLQVANSHPTISSNWNSVTGKLTLTGTFAQPSYADLILAIKDIQFFNSSPNPSGSRTFSITISQANYLPSNGHYYQYISNLGITWSNAKVAAEASSYYGLQGYLATITAADEAQLAGAQASGAGWIGGSDEQIEGNWKWLTGPETGYNMNYTFWNNSEPNNLNNEDYAHVTAPGVGIPGSWNDLSNSGEVSGDYQPKGYIVEYGGMFGDPILQIATSSTIIIPTITSTIGATSCDPNSLILNATSSAGSINWYLNATGGSPIASGNSFTTPLLSSTTTYYVDAFPLGCLTGNRTAIIATINNIPVITVNPSFSICGANTTTISAATTAGDINWFIVSNGGTPIATGTTFTTPFLTEDTNYYIEGNNNGCLSTIRVPVSVSVYELPNVTNEELVICEGKTITLDAGIENLHYAWSTNETSQTIIVSNPGTYTVTVTSLAPESCSKTKTINVTEHNRPQIQDVIVNGNLATILSTGFGDYEFSVDGYTFQDSNSFTILEGGLYTATIREKNNCGMDNKSFIIITIPEYFTPNNDGYNDSWMIKGLLYYPEAEVKIFDRFGRFITLLNPINYDWNGTLNNKLLPSDDYWYSLKINSNQPEIKGHFSLKR